MVWFNRTGGGERFIFKREKKGGFSCWLVQCLGAVLECLDVEQGGIFRLVKKKMGIYRGRLEGFFDREREEGLVQYV